MVSNKSIMVVSLLLVLFLAGCSGSQGIFSGSGANANKDYYEGNEGVRMNFVSATDPPSRMYYYNDAESDSFYVTVNVQNIGASWTRGGIYVSGYDPSMIEIEEIDIPRLASGWGDCTIDLGFLGGLFTGQVGCSDTGFNAYTDTQGGFGIGFDSIGKLLGIEEDDWWTDIGLTYESMGNGGKFSMDFGDNFNLNYLNNGKGLVILLSGLSFDRYNGQEYLLHPDNYDYPGGEMEQIVFNGHIKDWPQGLDRTDRPMPFLVTNCYVYSTYAAPQVCIDPAPEDQTRKVCTPRKITFNGGNGAPVAITSIEQENTKRKVYFTLNIKNVAGGQIFDLGYMERCSPYYPGRLTTRELDKVYLMDARIGNTHLECTPDRGQGIRLVNGQGQARCSYNMEYVTAKSAYETPLIVEVAYGYTDYMERRTMIKRAT